MGFIKIKTKFKKIKNEYVTDFRRDRSILTNPINEDIRWIEKIQLEDDELKQSGFSSHKARSIIFNKDVPITSIEVSGKKIKLFTSCKRPRFESLQSDLDRIIVCKKLKKVK